MRSVIAVAVAALVGVLTAAPASAAPSDVPADVRDAFAGSALWQAQDAAAHDGDGPDLSGPIRADGVRMVFSWSGGFLTGMSTAEPVTTTHQWLAAVTRGDDVLGTLRVWKPQGGPAQLAGFTDDADLGAALLELLAGEVLVEDPPTDAWFALAGDAVRPLDDDALNALPGPATLADLQPVVAARIERYQGMDGVTGGGATADVPADAGRWGDGTLLVGALALALVGAFAVRRSRRRSG